MASDDGHYERTMGQLLKRYDAAKPEQYPHAVSLPLSEKEDESLGKFLQRQCDQRAARALNRASEDSPPVMPPEPAKQVYYFEELHAMLIDIRRSLNRLTDIAIQHEALLEDIAARLPKPAAPPKSPLTMRAYRGMQCGFDDDR